MKATAVAHPNIALVKYWGKQDPDLNIPAVGSISITLDTLTTTTTVVFDERLEGDYFSLDGRTLASVMVQGASGKLNARSSTITSPLSRASNATIAPYSSNGR